jgi:RNA polymerase sigma factor for flagellar operon FliA
MKPTPAAAQLTVPQGERERRVLDYLPLVNYILSRLSINFPPHLEREDLFSAGVIGLIHAADSYDPDRGASFKTYAYTNIRGAILDELRRQDFLPRSQRDRMKRLNHARQRLEVKLGRAPTVPELARALKLPQSEVEETLLLVRSVTWLSLDERIGLHPDKGETSRMLRNPRAPDPADELLAQEERDLLADAIEKLPRVERQVILLYYRQGLLLREIGDVLGISESRVSQLHSRAVLHLNGMLATLREERPRPSA